MFKSNEDIRVNEVELDTKQSKKVTDYIKLILLSSALIALMVQFLPLAFFYSTHLYWGWNGLVIRLIFLAFLAFVASYFHYLYKNKGMVWVIASISILQLSVLVPFKYARKYMEEWDYYMPTRLLNYTTKLLKLK